MILALLPIVRPEIEKYKAPNLEITPQTLMSSFLNFFVQTLPKTTLGKKNVLVNKDQSPSIREKTEFRI